MRGLLKSTKTKIFGAVTVFVLAFIMPAMAMADLSPVLDSVNLYQIANTSDSAAWGTTAQADPGETLTFLVHIHNNVLETTANNVRVQAALPTGEVTSYTSRATVSADNASTVSGLTSFTLSSLAKVEYISGSSVLYNHNNQVVRTLPDGITTDGVSVGNFNGCWEYEQWIKFKVKVVKEETTPVTPTPVTPTPVTTTVVETPTSLPVSGSVEAMAGIFGTIGIGGAGYFYRKSRKNLKDSFKRF